MSCNYLLMFVSQRVELRLHLAQIFERRRHLLVAADRPLMFAAQCVELKLERVALLRRETDLAEQLVGAHGAVVHATNRRNPQSCSPSDGSRAGSQSHHVA